MEKTILADALLNGANAWNRTIQGSEGWDLSKTDLSKLEPIDDLLSITHGGDLFNEEFVFKNGSFRHSNFTNWDGFGSSTFERVDLAESKFIGTNLRFCKFVQCDLRGADFSGSNLSSAKFIACQLEGTTFANAVLSGCDFNDIRAEYCNFSHAQLNGISRIRMSNCAILDAKFGPWSRDAWSTIARTYTFPRFILDALTLIIALMPYILTAFALSLYEGALKQQTAKVITTNLEMTPVSIWWISLGGLRAWFLPTIALALIAHKLVRLGITFQVVEQVAQAQVTHRTASYVTLRETAARLRRATKASERADAVRAYVRSYHLPLAYHRISTIFLALLIVYTAYSIASIFFGSVEIPKFLLTSASIVVSSAS